MRKSSKRYVVDGKLMKPADLRRLHDYLKDMEVISVISDEMRAVVESEWSELAHKLPPKTGQGWRSPHRSPEPHKFNGC
jgi:hypothetical protein